MAVWWVRCCDAQILGVDRDAPSADVDKAYRVKMYAFRNDSAMLRKIEAAHSSLQLSALSNRKKVGACMGYTGLKAGASELAPHAISAADMMPGTPCMHAWSAGPC